MTSTERKRFTVISNEKLEKEIELKEKHRSYQTDPLRERLVKYVNEENKRKFSIEDMLKW